jgi:hypothetical protein
LVVCRDFGGTAGAVFGAQYDAVGMQYVGNGVFTLIGHEGTPFVR